MVANRTSTCSINFSAILMASKYCPLLTCRSISEIHAALDSSKAESTLGYGFREIRQSGSVLTSKCDILAVPSQSVFLSKMQVSRAALPQ
jgi:hypothetical protein